MTIDGLFELEELKQELISALNYEVADIEEVVEEAFVKVVNIALRSREEEESLDIRDNAVLGYKNAPELKFPNEVLRVISRAFENKGLVSVDTNKCRVVGENAFSNNKINSLIIEGVEEILNGAFENNCLVNVSFSNNLRLIRERAFKDNKIKELIIPDSVQIVDSCSFYCNEIERVLIGKGIVRIFEGTFALNKLRNIVIPDTIRAIDYKSFWDNPIDVIKIGTNVKVDRYAFDNALFSECYENNEREGGVYSFDGKVWIKVG